jgi:hypothetical protein
MRVKLIRLPGSDAENRIAEQLPYLWSFVICEWLLVIFLWIKWKGMRFELMRPASGSSLFWKLGWLRPALVENLIKEDRELAGILGASIRTAQAKASRISK